jgi:hypothetical protein
MGRTDQNSILAGEYCRDEIWDSRINLSKIAGLSKSQHAVGKMLVTYVKAIFGAEVTLLELPGDCLDVTCIELNNQASLGQQILYLLHQ